MKFEFDHRHYVPVLRFRRGEKVAMRQLRDDMRFRMTPLIEIVPITDYSPSTVADEIRNHWGPYPYFFDIHHLPEGEDPSVILRFDQAMRNHGLASVPVVQLINGVKVTRSSCAYRRAKWTGRVSEVVSRRSQIAFDVERHHQNIESSASAAGKD